MYCLDLFKENLLDLSREDVQYYENLIDELLEKLGNAMTEKENLEKAKMELSQEIEELKKVGVVCL
jgi:phage shock protein A